MFEKACLFFNRGDNIVNLVGAVDLLAVNDADDTGYCANPSESRNNIGGK